MIACTYLPIPCMYLFVPILCIPRYTYVFGFHMDWSYWAPNWENQSEAWASQAYKTFIAFQGASTFL